MESLVNVKALLDIHHSLLMHTSNHFIIEGNQVAFASFVLGKCMLITTSYLFCSFICPEMCIKRTHSMIFWALKWGKADCRFPRHPSCLLWGWVPHLFFFSHCGPFLIKWPFTDDRVLQGHWSAFLAPPDTSPQVPKAYTGWDFSVGHWLDLFPALVNCHFPEPYL